MRQNPLQLAAGRAGSCRADSTCRHQSEKGLVILAHFPFGPPARVHGVGEADALLLKHGAHEAPLEADDTSRFLLEAPGRQRSLVLSYSAPVALIFG